ncbi:hypothetical protein BZG35_03485 [Brevundimonas sp. LM2]|uniref:hypothetical protein n=1 Tax=Brevundimonas sp. LM2 TaxID=1938605 RepID=UPI000983AC3A|nr:hypothetical protein [Brevundimonas sp. LM2]AQR60818.1 hypothetical protein BZG35_03485 [Brevundimonas sp. LM2]
MISPDRRSAEIANERDAERLPIDHVAMRRSGIVECDDARDRFALALALAIHKPLSIGTARMVLASAPKGMTPDQSYAWAGRIVEADSDSLGAVYGH